MMKQIVLYRDGQVHGLISGTEQDIQSNLQMLRRHGHPLSWMYVDQMVDMLADAPAFDPEKAQLL